MTKLELYNQALSVLDLRIDSLDTDTREKRLLDLFYDKVVKYVLQAWEFPFLIKKVVLDNTVDDYWRFQFGYELPQDFGYVVQLNLSKDHSYSVRFGVLWTDIAEPVLEYIPNDIEVSEGKYTAPVDFLSLIAYQLALHVAPILDPQSDSTGVAAQLYQLTLANMIENDVRANDRPQRYEASEILGDTSRFDLAEYRRMLFERQK